ncbi:MAG: TonB family protein [Robiginitomaculum sp.]|nr:TonB family protein [Robiginitomaculum sp.]
MTKATQESLEGTIRPPNTLSSYVIIASVLIGFLILVCVAYMHYRAKTIAHNLTLNQQQHRAYQNIITEMRTGVRLARWRDFVKQSPENPYTKAARFQISALNVHEKSAWAQYSETLYEVKSNAKDIALARALYISQWSDLNRQEQLSIDMLDQPSKALSFKTAQSIYNKGGNTNTLSGGPQGRRVKIVPTLQNQKKSSRGLKSVIDVTVKTARKPHYPRTAKRRGIGAIVILSLNIDARGRVVSTELISVKAKRYRGNFIRAAKRAAKSSRFTPKTVNGHPVSRDNYMRTYTFVAD